MWDGLHLSGAEFARRVLHRWHALLPGLIGGLVGVAQMLGVKLKMPGWVPWLALGTSFLVAVILAFHDLRVERDERTVSVRGPDDPRYDAVSDLVGESLTVALTLSQGADWSLRDAWETATRRLIVSAYGEGEAAHVFTPDLSKQRVYRDEEIANAPRPLAEPIERIRLLLGRMPSLAIKPAFEPDEWNAFDPVAYRAENARATLEGKDERYWVCPWCGGEAGLFADCPKCGAERALDDVAYRKVIASNGTQITTPLAIWIQGRLQIAEEHAQERPVRGDDWFFRAMGQWDVENVQALHDGDDALAPELVERYRENPATGRTDGLRVSAARDVQPGEQERYMGQRVAWLRKTLTELRPPAKSI